MEEFSKNLKVGLKAFILLSLITGVCYPLAVTALAQLFFYDSANGSLVFVGKKMMGSELLAQKFIAEKYFWSRPSAIDYNAAGSGGSNLSLTSKKLFDQYQERLNSFSTGRRQEGLSGPPQDLLFASGSGLDPHISPEAAHFQVERVAYFRKIDSRRLHELVNSLVELRQFGILGEPRVNVLKLNLALDAM